MTTDTNINLYTAQDFKGNTYTGQLIIAEPTPIPGRKLCDPSYWLILSAHANGGWFAVGRRIRVQPSTVTQIGIPNGTRPLIPS